MDRVVVAIKRDSGSPALNHYQQDRPQRIQNDAVFVARRPYGQQTHREFIIYDRAQLAPDYLVTFRV